MTLTPQKKTDSFLLPSQCNKMDVFGFWGLLIIINLILLLIVFITLCFTVFKDSTSSSSNSTPTPPSNSSPSSNVPISKDPGHTNGILQTLVYSDRTDKNTTHSYLGVYNQLFEPIRNSVKRVAEIGICNGGSIKLWHDYFPNAEIHGIDIMPREQVWQELFSHQRIQIHADVDAYNGNWVKDYLSDKQFDIICDDGSHLLPHMQKCIEYYIPLLTPQGMLIIEDIPDMEWIPKLLSCVPAQLQSHVKVYDLRSNKNRFDDVLFVLQK
jgi:hypothetical protein